MAYVYTYEELEKNLATFRQLFPQIPVFSIGKSREGRHLYGLKLGKGGKRIFFNGAHHGMEWLTAKLLMQFAEELARGDHNAETLLGNRTLYIVPMVNPDGVEIAATGKEWQASAAGVDLNHNYDALWHLSKQGEKSVGVFGPGPTRFSGAFPESEPESRAVADFTRQNSFDLVLAFHSQGEVIYWDFCGFAPDKSYTLAKRFEAVSPYQMDTAGGIAAFGGYKDWFIRTFKRPGFTIEIGMGKNPLPIEDLPRIYQRTLPLMLEAIKYQ
ncbi:MAG: M14 family zinc carboxypeptidase [Clostridia bacterium]|nr:M14 family zinc carboxypeptidase [Clostridia bacterium]